MKRFTIPMLAALAAAAALGCASETATLEGAVFAGRVPVVHKASFDGRMGGTSYGDDPAETSKSMSWFFDTDLPMAEVVAFYEKELPGWTREQDSDGGSTTVTFTLRPEGAGEYERMQVIVSPGRVQIHESYDASRAPAGS